MTGFLLSVLLAATLSDGADASSDTVRGTYSVIVEGTTYSIEMYRRSSRGLEICSDVIAMNGTVAARWEREADGWRYQAVHLIGERAHAHGLRYEVRAEGDTIRYELEDPRSWTERRYRWEGADEVALFHSGVLSTYALLVSRWRSADAPERMHPEVIVADGGELAAWAIETHGDELLITSSEGVHSEIVLGVGDAPREVRIPEQSVLARLTPDTPKFDERMDRCLDLLEWIPGSEADD